MSKRPFDVGDKADLFYQATDLARAYASAVNRGRFESRNEMDTLIFLREICR